MLRTLKSIKAHSMLIVVGLFYVYLMYHVLSGSQGIFKLARYDSEISQLQSKIVTVQAQRLTLEQRASHLRSSALSRDLLDERARDLLSVSYAKDIVIILDE